MVNVLPHFPRLNRRFQHGAAAIEFAILVVPLLLMLFGVSEYGRAIYQYNTLAKSVRDATRYLSTVAPGDGHDQAQCLALYGKTTCGGPPLVPLNNQDTLQVIICDANTPGCQSTHNGVDTGSGTINLVTVTIRGYKFRPLPFNLTYYGQTIGLPGLITFDPIQNTMRQAS